MRAADLNRARDVVEAIAGARATIEKLAAGKVFLGVGEGVHTSRITLAPSYLAGIVAEVKASLEQSIAAGEQALRDMGVEP